MWGDLLFHLEIGADGTPAIISSEWKPNPKIDPPPFHADGAKDVVLSIRYPLAWAHQPVDLVNGARRLFPETAPPVLPKPAKQITANGPHCYAEPRRDHKVYRPANPFILTSSCGFQVKCR